MPASMGLEMFERGALPPWRRLTQELDDGHVADVRQAVAATFAQQGVADTIEPGMSVALGVGSRGIDRLAEVVSAVVAEVRRRGAQPFIVPAMGSHGGASAAGQQAVLAEYGVQPDVVGAPVRSCLDTVLVGTCEGVPLFFDRIAATEADRIIPINRIKPHTDFHASIESGLCKMIVIGFGKQVGADTLHSYGFDRFGELLPRCAEWLVGKLPIPFGLALLENGLGQLAGVEAVPCANLLRRERQLLEIARRRMARLPDQRIDVLIIDRIGKDISGIGADTNVIHRYYNGTLPLRPAIGRIIVRDLSAATEGNASGIGLADIVLRQAVDKMDHAKTYMNCVTAKTPEGARVPMTLNNDRQALYVALACAPNVTIGSAAIVRIRDTKSLQTLWGSEPYAAPLIASAELQARSAPEPIRFDRDGMLVDGGYDDA